MLAKTTPLLTSVLAHVAAVTAFAGHAALSPSAGESVTPTEIAIVAEEAPAPVAPDPEAPVARPASKESSPHAHHHAYPVAPDHDARDHDPSLVHAPLGAPPPAEEQAVAPAAPPIVAAPPRFTMSFGGDHDHDRDHDRGQPVTAAPASAPETVPESSVARPARLLASAALAYPAAARDAEVEADVPLELVVDVTGAVIDARVLRPAGLGLDAAALTAVRRYRFTPAERGGHPVRVRMRWSVEFRLR